MAYQPNIPTGTVPLNQDYLNLQGNFSQLNITYGVDHVPLTDTTGIPPAGITGMHTAIHMVPVSTVASNAPNNQPINGYTATPGAGQIFNAQINDGINTDEALYFLSGGGRLTQFTRNILPGQFINNYTPQSGGGPVGVAFTAGSTFLPGGMLMQYGLRTGISTPSAGTVKFPFNFSSIMGVQITPILNGVPGGAFSIGVRNVTTTQFQYETVGSSTLTSFYWTAIGI